MRASIGLIAALALGGAIGFGWGPGFSGPGFWGPGLPAAAQSADDADEWDGLAPGPGREEVYYQCRPCHSLAIVKQQRLSRRVWDEVLIWMVEEQGMPEPGAEEREAILEYLSTHFGPDIPR